MHAGQPVFWMTASLFGLKKFALSFRVSCGVQSLGGSSSGSTSHCSFRVTWIVTLPRPPPVTATVDPFGRIGVALQPFVPQVQGRLAIAEPSLLELALEPSQVGRTESHPTSKVPLRTPWWHT